MSERSTTTIRLTLRSISFGRLIALLAMLSQLDGADIVNLRSAIDSPSRRVLFCCADAVLANLSKVVAMLKDKAEFVRMQAARTIAGRATRSVLCRKPAGPDAPPSSRT